MLILDATTKSLEIVLGGAVTTNQLPAVAAYVDFTSTTTAPGSSDTISNNTSTVTLVSAPSASTQRQVKYLSIYNADTVQATITIRLNDNSTLRNILITTLDAGDTLFYSDTNGFYTIDSAGNRKSSGANALLGYNNTWTGANTFDQAPTITPFNTAGFVKNNASGVLSTGTIIAGAQFYQSEVTNAVVYPLTNYATFAFTILKAWKVQTTTGTVTLNVKINSTSVTGLSSISVTSTPQDVTATAANIVAVGDAVTVTPSSNANAQNVQFFLEIERTS